MAESVEISEDTWWTIFGAILAIIGCIFQAIGFIIQKIGHNEIEQYNKSESINHQIIQQENVSYDADEEILSEEDGSENSKTNINKSHRNKHNEHSNKLKKKRYIQSKTWIFGFFLNGIIGSLLNIIALNYAPQSVVLPLSATTLVGNTILATKYLNEAFPIQDWIGVLLVMIGSIGTIIVGPKESNGDTFTVLNLKSQWLNPPFLIFFSSISFLIVMDFLILKIFDRINDRKKSMLIENDIIYFEGKEIGEHTIVYMSFFYLMSYPVISAYFASINFLVLKSFTQIITSSANNFTYWLTYVYIIGIIIINFLLEMFRQKGLRAFGAIYVIPIFQVLVITMGTTMGAIYFNEMENMKPLNAILFICSVFVTTVGVIILGLSNKIDQFIRRANCRRYLLNISMNDYEYQDKQSHIIHTDTININENHGVEIRRL